MNNLDLRLWQARYREYLQVVKDFSPATVATYVAELKPFFAYLARQGLSSFAALALSHLEGYRLELMGATFKGQPLSRSTQGVRLSAIKQFSSYLFRDHYLLLDLAARFEIPSRSASLPRVILSEKEAVQLMEAPDIKTSKGIRDRALLEMLYGTAIRNSELCTLRIDQVDLERKVLRVEGKGRKVRMIPIGEEAEVWLEEYLLKVRPLLVLQPDQTLVFLGWRGGALRKSWLAQLCSQLARAAGLEKKVTPHVLRHSCATHMLRRGAGLRQLQGLLGHSSLNTTQIYTHLELSDLAKTVRRYHPREQ